MKALLISIEKGVEGFVDDKDMARNIRTDKIMPAIQEGRRVVLDFSRVNYSTQSFIHALVGQVLKEHRETALKKLEFKDCSPQLKILIQLVVDYSLGGFRKETSPRTKVKRVVASNRGSRLRK